MSGHDTPIKTPKQLIIAIALGFVVPVVVIILLTRFIGAQPKPGAGSNLFTAEATAQRVAPVGVVSTEAPVGVAVVAAVAKVRSGEEVYKAKCAGCHTAGALGSPKIGDKAAWAPRLGQGYQALVSSAIKGKGRMGGQAVGGYTEEEVAAAVKHLTNASGGSF